MRPLHARETLEDDDAAEVRSDPADEDLVTCVMSGRRVRREDAVEVRLGSRKKVWMLAEFCREPEPRDT